MDHTRYLFDKARLQAQGFLHIASFIKRPELDALQRDVMALVADTSLMVPREGAEHFFQKYQSTSYCYVDQHGHAPAIAALVDNPHVHLIARELLSGAGVFHSSLVQYHEAGAGQGIPWHQDIDAEAAGPAQMFNFLFYPFDTDIESGALHVVPGSHGSTRLPLGEPHGDLPGQELLCPRAGDLLIVDCTLFHKVNHNHSARGRVSINLRFCRADLDRKHSSVGIYRNGRVNYAG